MRFPCCQRRARRWRRLCKLPGAKIVIFPKSATATFHRVFRTLSAVLALARGRQIMPPKLPSSPGRPCLHPMRARALLSPLHDPVMGELIFLLVVFVIGFACGYSVREWISRRRRRHYRNRRAHELRGGDRLVMDARSPPSGAFERKRGGLFVARPTIYILILLTAFAGPFFTDFATI
jgi:hypothetical protein